MDARSACIQNGIHLDTCLCCRHGGRLLPGLHARRTDQTDLMIKNKRDRDLICLCGFLLDRITLADTMRVVHEAVRNRSRLFISTANMDFLTISLNDSAFRQALLDSDLCVADGMPLVWMSRLLGARLPERVTGSDLFERLSQEPPPPGDGPLKVFFFGGLPGAAQTACERLNAHSVGMVCVGVEMPGFGRIEDMSTADVLERINASGADFLVVALSARKAQQWIVHNLKALNVPVICDLGAVINFQAGHVKRAPAWLQHNGIEWLWRIKEEPELWRRYWFEFKVLTALLRNRILPYAFWLTARRRTSLLYRFGQHWKRKQYETDPDKDDLNASISLLEVEPALNHAKLTISGSLDADVPLQIRFHLQRACDLNLPIVLEVTRLESFGPRFAGLLLLFQESLRASGQPLSIQGMSGRLHRLFKWNGLEWNGHK